MDLDLCAPCGIRPDVAARTRLGLASGDEIAAVGTEANLRLLEDSITRRSPIDRVRPPVDT